MLDNWEVDPVGLNGGEGIEIEGYQVNLQVTASLDRGKKRQDKDSVEEMYQLTPHSPRMVHGAPQRFLRLLMVRGALAGSYSRLEGAAAAEMRARVRMPGFTGLDAKECGFENFTEMAAACKARHWAKEENVGSWSTFPAVDVETDAFLQETPEDAQVLANRVKNVGNHLGYDGYFGVWSCRKLGAALVHEGVGAATSSMWLGHAGDSGRAVYMRGVPGLDVGSLYTGRAQAKVHIAGFASWRTPEATVRFMRDVDPESQVLAARYTNVPERLEARRNVSDTYNWLRLAAGDKKEPVAADGSSKDLKLTRSFLGKLRARAQARGAELSEQVERTLECLETRRRTRSTIESQCVDWTIKLEGQRLREEALAKLRTQPELRIEREESFDWPRMKVEQAVAFSLDRPNLPGARCALRTLPFALQECVLESGALGLLGDTEMGKVKQHGNGSSRIEQSELFKMACTSCNAGEVPVLLEGRTRGRYGQWRLLCHACQVFDEMDVWCVLGSAALIDEHVLACGAPVVSRATYSCWRTFYNGDAYSCGQPLRHASKPAMKPGFGTELDADALEAAAGEELEAFANQAAAAGVAAVAAEAAAAAAAAAARAAASRAVAASEVDYEADGLQKATVANVRKRRPQRCSVCHSLDHRKPQCDRDRAVAAKLQSDLPAQAATVETWDVVLEGNAEEIEIDEEFFQSLMEEGESFSQELG